MTETAQPQTQGKLAPSVLDVKPTSALSVEQSVIKVDNFLPTLKSLPFLLVKATDEFNPVGIINVEPVQQPLWFSKNRTLENQTTIRFSPPMDSKGRVRLNLDPREKAHIENEFGFELTQVFFIGDHEKSISPYSVEIPPNGMVLDLSNGEDYLRYKTLLYQNDTSAGTLVALNDTQALEKSVCFHLVQKSVQVENRNTQLSAKAKAFSFFSTLTSNEKRAVARVLNPKLTDVNDAQIDNQLLMTIDDTTTGTEGINGAQRFLLVATLADISIREVIAKAMSKKILFKSNKQIAFGSADNILGESESHVSAYFQSEKGKVTFETVKKLLDEA